VAHVFSLSFLKSLSFPTPFSQQPNKMTPQNILKNSKLQEPNSCFQSINLMPNRKEKKNILHNKTAQNSVDP
jgi:hypothetical protein